MRTLWRAASTKETGRGACFAALRQDAEAYLDNPGFGGENLYSVDVNPEYVLYLDDIRDIGEYLFTEEEILDQACELGLDHGEELSDFFKRISINQLIEDSGKCYIHDYMDDPEIRNRLAEDYNWVVYEDSYPAQCETWMLLDGDLELTEVVD